MFVKQKKNIFKDIVNLNLPDNIVKEANTLCHTLLISNIYR